MKFRDLSVGDAFDWVNDDRPDLTSFYERCRKIGPRRYTTAQGFTYRVGSINAEVFHVERKQEDA
jgi:hypothetical protein